MWAAIRMRSGVTRTLSSLQQRYASTWRTTSVVCTRRAQGGVLTQSLHGSRRQLFLTTRRALGSAPGSSGSGQDDGSAANPEEDFGPITQTLPATVVVPEVWPNVPLVAISRNPVFPRFIKLIEVRECFLILKCPLSIFFARSVSFKFTIFCAADLRSYADGCYS